MIPALVRLIELLSLLIFRISFIFVFGMIVAIGYEVVSRYFFGAPTIWSFDMTYMLNGAILMFAAAWTLREGGHVRVDVLDAKIGAAGRRVLDAIFYILFCAPVLSVLGWFAVTRAWKAYTTGEVEVVSPWQPLIWPFDTAIAIGLIALALQCLAEGLKRCTGQLAAKKNDEMPEAI